jgi:FixJ family two-component response regulator
MTDASRLVIAAIDDDESILWSVGHLLESADYAARLFTSATEFLASDCLPEIDCLISDIDMPAIDGFELARLVHAARPSLPTILVTGYPDTLKRLPAAGKSVSSVLTKPFHGPELLAAVENAVRRCP